MKELPKTKKSFKNFILEEDAKIINKSAIRVALMVSFIGISVVANLQDTNAKGCNQTTHKNIILHEGNKDVMGNDGSTVQRFSESGSQTICGKTVSKSIDIDVPAKTVGAVHANHYNHTNGSGSS